MKPFLEKCVGSQVFQIGQIEWYGAPQSQIVIEIRLKHHVYRSISGVFTNYNNRVFGGDGLL